LKFGCALRKAWSMINGVFGWCRTLIVVGTFFPLSASSSALTEIFDSVVG